MLLHKKLIVFLKNGVLMRQEREMYIIRLSQIYRQNGIQGVVATNYGESVPRNGRKSIFH